MATTVTTAFTGRFWSPAELVRTAVARGYQSVGLADIGGFFGAVEFYRNAQQHGIEPSLGVVLWCHQCGWLQFTVRTRHGYRKLNELLTCTAGEVLASPDHLKRILSEAGDDFWVSLSLLRPCAPFPGISPPEALVPWWMRNWNWLLNHAPAENCWLELGWRDEYERSAQRRVYQQLAHAGWDRWVIMSHARMADTADSWRLELTQSIGTLTRVAQEHPAKLSPGEDSLAYAEVMAQRWSKVPSVLESTRRFASGCAFEMELGRLHLPGWDADGDNIPDAHQANARLAWLCLRGLVRRYRKEPYPWPDKPESSALLQRLQRELNVVREVGFAGYFLIFHAIVEQCRRRQIPLLARGSAAGSLICHALGVSNVCPFRFGLSFERFLNLDRMRHSKLPDIDLDLPWDQRDEILEWMYQHFGPERVAMIGGFSTYQARGALAEVAKAMGLPAARAHELSKRLPHGALHRFISRAEHYVEAAPVLEDAENNRMLAAAVALDGLPRHPMMHPCGAVIADRKLTHFLPLQSSAKGLHMTQFDMHAVEETGLLKLDLLGQAGLSVLRDVEQNLCSEGVANPWAGLDLRRPELYHACARGDVRGIFTLNRLL
ncbi:MAG: PHP domain-containing protein [Verrucomicrobia bacterium]|nr:PHP domain-containing protein [Verrucomicrobiota bacterium]